jgi:NADPH:quinone reductase-like Zn-dependent oxidoreductase
MTIAGTTSRPARQGERTKAWILRKGPDHAPRQRGRLEHAELILPPLPDDHVLVETLYGSWEGNMTHALNREPIDVCRRLGQDFIVLGNSAVVRVLATGRSLRPIGEGTLCMFAPVAKQDVHGYVRTVCAFDEPNTMGCLAERFHVKASQLIPVPEGTAIAPSQWASFLVRYASARSNWRVALGAWRLQMAAVPPEQIHVWAWGGGVAYAELLLARAIGCQTVMLHTGPERRRLIGEAGITPVERTPFALLSTPAVIPDRKMLVARTKVERAFINLVDQMTGGSRVSIFIDNIGGPLVHSTLRALGRQGVLATTGWKRGLDIEFNRAAACLNRQLFVHTHATPLGEATEAVRYAVENNWVPPLQERIYRWHEIPDLAEGHAAGHIATFFPTFMAAAAEHL